MLVIDRLERLLSTRDRCRRQPSIEGREPTAMSPSKSQQVGIGDLRRRRETLRIDERRSNQADIVRPKHMPAPVPDPAHDGADRGWRLGRIGVLRVFHDAQDTVLRERACCESPAADALEPRMGLVMCDLCRIDQGDQGIDIRHGSSTRSVFTTPRVTDDASGELWRSGMPFRSAAGRGRCDD